MNEEGKTCKECGVIKTLDEFPLRMDRGKQRAEARCIECKRKVRTQVAHELAEYTAGVVAGIPGADAVMAKLTASQMDPDAAANFMQTVTRGNCGSYSGDKKVVGSAFSTAVRAMTGVGPELPGWERAEDYDPQARCMQEGMSDERIVAEFMQRLGNALIAWCDKEDIAREEAKRKAKERTKKRKAKTRPVYTEAENEEEPEE